MRGGFSEVWMRTVTRLGKRRAIVEAASGREATFEKLAEGAHEWGRRHLPPPRELGGRMVVFAQPNGITWVEMFLAITSGGGVAVPLDPGEPPESVAQVVEALGGGFTWDGRVLKRSARLRRFQDPETVLIKLTSGSTGRPRPLVFTVAQTLADARQVTHAMEISDSDLNYASIPFGHSYGLGNLSLPLIAQGIPVVCGSSGLPQAIAADFERWRATVFPGVPALWRALVRADIPAQTLVSLRLGISAGAPLPAEVAREFLERFGRRLHAFYGSSETGGIAFDPEGSSTLAGGVGRALDGVRLMFGPGQRLSVSSPAVCTFGKRADRSGRVVWTMPDRVEQSDDGSIVLLGRRGSVVKLAGRRVSLGEVEMRLRRLPGVRDAWLGVSDGDEPVLGAAVVSDRSSADLRTSLVADTAPWKIPKRLVVLSAFPVTARGKVDSSALRQHVFGKG